MVDFKRKTFFVDIDGTLLEFVPTLEEMESNPNIPALSCAAQKTKEWYRQGHLIIVTTARPESTRPITIQQLANAGIFYHHLLMNLGDGERIIINDHVTKPDGSVAQIKALAFSVERNIDGLSKIWM
jgi:hypothetical protein